MAKTATVTFGPTLDVFSRRFPEDMYTEQELIELYQDEYGSVPTTESSQASVTIKMKRDALEWLILRLSTSPSSDQPIGMWIDQKIVKKLPIGILTLGDLITWINMTGIRWYEKVPGLGHNRAKRILIFFLQNEALFTKGLSNQIRFRLEEKYKLDEQAITDAEVKTPTRQEKGLIDIASSQNSGQAQVFGIVPIESLAWPPALLGHDGTFRNHNPNTYGAENDRMAIHEWFKTLGEMSPATQDSYRRSIERLILWAVVERGCSLSSLTTNDFVAFRKFLRDPPAHWCSKFPAMKFSDDWRPLRGPMGDASIQATMSAVSTMFIALMRCGYISANAAGDSGSPKRTVTKMDVMRSFSEDDLAVIKRTFLAISAEGNADMESGQDQTIEHKKRMEAYRLKRRISATRLRAIILLFQTTGMRRSEVANLTWGQLSQLRLDNKISDMWAATFIGKGNKQRIVPLQAGTMQALQDHYDDRMALVAQGVLPYQNMKKEDVPVLSILDYRLTERKAGSSDNPTDAPRDGNVNGALSSARIYMILKLFFKEVQKNVESSGHVDFLKASTHWLRHTFAHQALKGSNRDVAAVQQILGHADIGTTGLYTKADMTSRVAAISSVAGFDV
ncbi:phage integrase family protein [Rhodoferax antarcticus ANT.BR]|uniref:Phage integrase family protein n=2 Tax=Rhodoferax antarcticus TaxID=81479 RepID=A0A1Q8Y9B6_9BURK|nr:phage integrase family protein [Rhodoferax antarcticus ANT.BR]